MFLQLWCLSKDLKDFPFNLTPPNKNVFKAMTNGTPTIYVFTDSEFFSDHIQTHLRPNFAVHSAYLKSIHEMKSEEWASIEQEAVAVLVDWREINFEALQIVRKRLPATAQIPLFAMTFGDESSRMAAMLAGADDYFPPHVSLSMLQLSIKKHRERMVGQVAHVNSSAKYNGQQERRDLKDADPNKDEQTNGFISASNGKDPTPSTHDIQKLGVLHLDLTARKLYINQCHVRLSRQEFDFLSFLMLHPGACQSRDILLREVWKYDVDMDCNPIDGAIHRLRKKLRKHGADKYLTTVYGVGFRLDAED